MNGSDWLGLVSLSEWLACLRPAGRCHEETYLAALYTSVQHIWKVRVNKVARVSSAWIDRPSIAKGDTTGIINSVVLKETLSSINT